MITGPSSQVACNGQLLRILSTSRAASLLGEVLHAHNLYRAKEDVVECASEECPAVHEAFPTCRENVQHVLACPCAVVQNVVTLIDAKRK